MMGGKDWSWTNQSCKLEATFTGRECGGNASNWCLFKTSAQSDVARFQAFKPQIMHVKSRIGECETSEPPETKGGLEQINVKAGHTSPLTSFEGISEGKG
jgi:hypothetical protein